MSHCLLACAWAEERHVYVNGRWRSFEMYYDWQYLIVVLKRHWADVPSSGTRKMGNIHAAVFVFVETGVTDKRKSRWWQVAAGRPNLVAENSNKTRPTAPQKRRTGH